MVSSVGVVIMKLVFSVGFRILEKVLRYIICFVVFRLVSGGSGGML